MTPLQQRLTTTALALLATVFILAVLLGTFFALREFVTTFSGVLWPLAMAGILALLFKPVIAFFQQRLRLGRIGSIVLLYALFFLLLFGLLAWLVPLLFIQITDLLERLPQIAETLRTELETRFPDVQAFLNERVGQDRLEAWFQNLITSLQDLVAPGIRAAGDALGFFTQVIAIGTGLAIIPVYLFFFLQTDRDVTADLSSQLSFIRKDWREDLVFLIKEFAGSMVAFFRGQLVIGLIMGILMAIGFSLAGVKFGAGFGLLAGFLNIIPYFGTIIGLATVLPMAYLQPDGGIALAGIALGIFVAVQVLEGYVLTPRIMGEQTGLHPLTIIIAIFFWGTALNGLLGMILAIPLTAFFVVAWRLMRKKYLSRLSPETVPESSAT